MWKTRNHDLCLRAIRIQGQNRIKRETWSTVSTNSLLRSSLNSILVLISPYRPPVIPGVLEDPVVLDIARSHSKTPAQILLRHLMQQNIVVIPKSVSKNRIQENFGVIRAISKLYLLMVSEFFYLQIKIFDFALTEAEMSLLNNLDKNHRTFDFQILAE